LFFHRNPQFLFEFLLALTLFYHDSLFAFRVCLHPHLPK
jgi:hypothetical protein